MSNKPTTYYVTRNFGGIWLTYRIRKENLIKPQKIGIL